MRGSRQLRLAGDRICRFICRTSYVRAARSNRSGAAPKALTGEPANLIAFVASSRYRSRFI